MISIEHYLSVDVECRWVDVVDVNLENQVTLYLKPVFLSTWLENNKFVLIVKFSLFFHKKIKVIFSKMKESNFVCFDLFSNKW